MTKPDIDLSDPRVRAVIKLLHERAEIAYDAAEPLADAVRPLFARHPTRDVLRQVGSGVLLALADRTFLLSASHIFDHVGEDPVAIGCGAKIHVLGGERFSTPRGPSGTHSDDPIDASVFDLGVDAPLELRDASLHVSQLDLAPTAADQTFLVSLGYRVAKGKRWAKTFRSKQDRFPTIEISSQDYAELGLDRERSIAGVYETQVPKDGRWQLAPSLAGMSGGALVRVHGVPSDLELVPSKSIDAKLCAITIERGGGPGRQLAIVGTKIGVHLGLIERYLPGFLNIALSDNAYPDGAPASGAHPAAS